MKAILKKLHITLLLVLPLVATNAMAQQVNYTQYMNNLTPLNPTFSLVRGGVTVNTILRKQWLGIPGAPTTFIFDGSIPIESIGASAGLIVSNDVFAIEHKTDGNFFFAKAISLGQKTKLAVSLNGGFRSYIANYSSVDVTDRSFSTDVRETSPNIGFGVMFYSDNYFVGVSMPEMNIRQLGNASTQDVTNFQNHYYFTAGYTMPVGSDFKLKYVGLASYTKNIPVAGDLSATAIVKNVFELGVNVRTTKEVAGVTMLHFDRFNLGYSYQFATSQSNIGSFSNATQEFSLGFRFANDKDK